MCPLRQRAGWRQGYGKRARLPFWSQTAGYPSRGTTRTIRYAVVPLREDAAASGIGLASPQVVMDVVPPFTVSFTMRWTVWRVVSWGG